MFNNHYNVVSSIQYLFHYVKYELASLNCVSEYQDNNEGGDNNKAAPGALLSLQGRHNVYALACTTRTLLITY